MRQPWTVFKILVLFALDYVLTATNTGTYYEAIYTSNTKQAQENQILHRLQKYLHRCSINLSCNYVVEDNSNAIKLYNFKSDIPAEEELIAIWKKMPRKYSYKVFVEKLNWHDAREKCQLHGGDLASVTSNEEEEKVKELISYFASNVYFWIGLNDVEEEGKYVWSDGSDYIYNNWKKGDPNNFHNEDCIFLEPLMKWYDYGCQNKEYFICKNEIVWAIY